MKIPHSIATLVSEFAHLNRTPVYNPRITEPCSSEDDEDNAPQDSAPPTKYKGERRHSINITVGAEQIPVVPTPPNETSEPCAPKYNKNARRQSAPCISGIACSTTLKEKMGKMKKSNSVESLREEEDEQGAVSKKNSIVSYRMI